MTREIQQDETRDAGAGSSSAPPAPNSFELQPSHAASDAPATHRSAQTVDDPAPPTPEAPPPDRLVRAVPRRAARARRRATLVRILIGLTIVGGTLLLGLAAQRPVAKVAPASAVEAPRADPAAR